MSSTPNSLCVSPKFFICASHLLHLDILTRISPLLLLPPSIQVALAIVLIIQIRVLDIRIPMAVVMVATGMTNVLIGVATVDEVGYDNNGG